MLCAEEREGEREGERALDLLINKSKRWGKESWSLAR